MEIERLERRVIKGHKIELRQADGESAKLAGYAAVFNVLSYDMGGFQEIVKPGAFDATLAAGDDVLFRDQHDEVLGRTSANTLRLWVDEKGLGFELDLPDTTSGRDLAEMVRRGDVTECSFAFRVHGPEGDRWSQGPLALLRELLSVKLVDVATTLYPAYPETEVALRSLEDWKAKQSSQLPSMHMRLALAENAH